MLDPWQAFALEVGLSERADGKWSAFEVAAIVSRQNGKGALFEALALAKMFLFGDDLLIWSAHEFKTAKEAFRRLGILLDTADLAPRVLRPVRNPSEFGFDLRTGQRIRFFARSGGSGRGWSADTLIIDEAFNLGGAAMAALLPTLSTRPNPQVWYASSAAMATSEQLHAIRARALGDEPGRLAYLEWSAPEDADIHDREAWALANPALGYRLTEEFIEAEVRALPEPEFRRERLSIPDMPTGAAVIPAALWASCADVESSAVDPVAFAVDVSPSRDRATIAVAGKRADGRPHVALVDAREGTDWVVPRLIELQRHNPVAVSLDPSGAAGALLQPLTEARVEVLPVTARGLTQACGRFFDLVVAGELRHRDEALLNAAVAGAGRRVVGDAWAWGRKGSAADLTPLYAATLALWAFGEADPPSSPTVLFL